MGAIKKEKANPKEASPDHSQNKTVNAISNWLPRLANAMNELILKLPLSCLGITFPMKIK